MTSIAAQEGVTQDHSSKKASAKSEKVKTDEPAKAADVPEIKIEDIRGVLAEVSQAGGTAKVKELLSSFGANKLSAVDPSKYADLLAAAKELL